MKKISELIMEKINTIEKDMKCEILFVGEIGSRAKKMNNEKSDYDVGFIYKYNNIIDYIGCNRKANNINFKENNIDYTGWDIIKVITLIKKGNYTPIEWINSNIIYYPNFKLSSALNHIYSKDFNKFTILKHHSSLGLNNINDKFRRSIYSYLLCQAVIHKEIIYKFDVDSMINYLTGIIDNNLLLMIKDYIECLRKMETYDNFDVLHKRIKEELREVNNMEIKKNKRPSPLIYNEIIKEVLGI